MVNISKRKIIILGLLIALLSIGSFFVAKNVYKASTIAPPDFETAWPIPPTLANPSKSTKLHGFSVLHPKKTKGHNTYFGYPGTHKEVSQNEYCDAIDLGAPKGTPVYSVFDGTVYYVASDAHGAKQIRIVNDKGYKAGFFHIVNVKLNANDTVKAGQKIGTIYKDHLHFELVVGGHCVAATSAEQAMARADGNNPVSGLAPYLWRKMKNYLGLINYQTANLVVTPVDNGAGRLPSVRMSWQANVNTYGYIRYREKGDPRWQYALFSGQSPIVEIPGLLFGKTYEFTLMFEEEEIFCPLHKSFKTPTWDSPFPFTGEEPQFNYEIPPQPLFRVQVAINAIAFFWPQPTDSV